MQADKCRGVGDEQEGEAQQRRDAVLEERLLQHCAVLEAEEGALAEDLDAVRGDKGCVCDSKSNAQCVWLELCNWLANGWSLFQGVDVHAEGAKAFQGSCSAVVLVSKLL